jgi:hypothetical protein
MVQKLLKNQKEYLEEVNFNLLINFIVPKAEKCFSIIGPATVDGVKAINVECEQEEEVNKWINYLEIIINYFKKTKAIKTAVVIKK